MSTLTIRLPDATHSRLKRMAKAHGRDTTKQVEEMATAAEDGMMRP